MERFDSRDVASIMNNPERITQIFNIFVDTINGLEKELAANRKADRDNIVNNQQDLKDIITGLGNKINQVEEGLGAVAVVQSQSLPEITPEILANANAKVATRAKMGAIGLAFKETALRSDYLDDEKVSDNARAFK